MKKEVSGTIARFPSKSQKISKKSLTNLTVAVVISHNLKPVKISYANGRVSVRIFHKNNSSSKSELRFIKLIRKKIHRVLVP
jgi:hypothetical protein